MYNGYLALRQLVDVDVHTNVHSLPHTHQVLCRSWHACLLEHLSNGEIPRLNLWNQGTLPLLYVYMCVCVCITTMESSGTSLMESNTFSVHQ